MAFTPISTQSFYGHSYANIASALEAVEANERNGLIDIAIIPPDADYNTDEDDVDSDDITQAELPNGTVRENRVKKCPLKPKKEVQKLPRGYYEFKHDTNNGIIFVKWNDNNAVIVGSNFDDVEPLNQVKRWSLAEKKKINVPQPRLIANYNAGMGGVDLHDQAVNAYRIRIRSKKWWWSLFTWMLNATMVNAWKLYRAMGSGKEDLLTFQRYVTRHYLRHYTVPTTSKRSVVPSVAKSTGPHFPKKILPNSDAKCVLCVLGGFAKCATSLYA